MFGSAGINFLLVSRKMTNFETFTLTYVRNINLSNLSEEAFWAIKIRGIRRLIDIRLSAEV